MVPGQGQCHHGPRGDMYPPLSKFGGVWGVNFFQLWGVKGVNIYIIYITKCIGHWISSPNNFLNIFNTRVIFCIQVWGSEFLGEGVRMMMPSWWFETDDRLGEGRDRTDDFWRFEDSRWDRWLWGGQISDHLTWMQKIDLAAWYLTPHSLLKIFNTPEQLFEGLLQTMEKMTYLLTFQEFLNRKVEKK